MSTDYDVDAMAREITRLQDVTERLKRELLIINDHADRAIKVKTRYRDAIDEFTATPSEDA